MTPSLLRRRPASDWLLAIIAALLAIFALRLGREFFAPMAIAWLAAMVLVALFDRIERLRPFGRKLPGWAVYIVGLLGAAVLVFALSQVVVSQLRHFAATLPAYASRVADLHVRLDELLGPETTAYIWDLVAGLKPSVLLAAAVNGIGATMGTLVLIALYVAFMLVDGGSLSRKIASLGRTTGERAHIAEALAAIRGGVQQYMLVKTLISGATAIIVYALLRLIGVDFALTWAAAAFLLNFIPNIGSIVATALPVAWAAVQFPTFGPPLVTLVTVGIVQFAFGNFLDPLFSGRRLNLGPLVIILSLSFWSMLWGITGAFLAVPMTVVIAIVALHTPPLRPLAVLLSGDEGAPSPPPVPDPTPYPNPDPIPHPAPRPGAPAPAGPMAGALDGAGDGADRFAGDIAAIRADLARDAAAAATEVPPGPAFTAVPPAARADREPAAPGFAGLGGVLQGVVVEWLGEEVALRTGLDRAVVEREIGQFMAEVARDPGAYGSLLNQAGTEALDLVRRHPAATALVAAAIGFVISRIRK